MGLLKVGVPQDWDKSKANLHYVRQAGIRQFVSTWNRVKDLKGDELLWGDEVEYGIFHLDHKEKKVRLSLRAKEVMDELNAKEQEHHHRMEGCTWVPEYGAWMVEATPSRPYTGYTNDLLRVERNMRLRRTRLLTTLKEHEVAPTVSAFPLLGALGHDGSVPATPLGGPVTQSDYIGDGIINPHPRFATLSANIRQRRKNTKVNIKVPLYRDTHTPEFKNYPPMNGINDCCGVDGTRVWRYGQEDAGKDHVMVGCSKSSSDHNITSMTHKKWLVNVKSPGCRGIFYRSAPGVIVSDADWPRNGDIVIGSAILNIPGWIRLQNGYYLPIASEDGKIPFLYEVSTETSASNTEKRNLGSATPLFHGNKKVPDRALLVDLLGNKLSLNDDGDDAQSYTSNTMDSTNSNNDTDTTGDGGDIDSDKQEINDNVRPAVHMDAMAFGMGCCCLQITFQAKDMDESRFMFDQLAVMAPIMMALTASTPVLRGKILDTDCRWGIISESVDCRTPAERGLTSTDNDDDDDVAQPQLAAKGQRRIYKSRYDSISTYIYQGAATGKQFSAGMENRILNTYNDIQVEIDEDSFRLLREAGVDPALSQHIAHLFIRDPLVIFDGAVEEVDDATHTEHFESIQSTNWQSVRWKPPPPRLSPNCPHIGWRTEFRSMEIQLTDFENSAFTVFIVLLTRVILSFDLNLYIPLSRVDQNMQRAHSRDAARRSKFFFRRHLAPLEEGDDGYGVKYTSMFSRSSQELNGSNGSLSTNGMVMSSHSVESNNVDENGVSQQRKKAPVAPGGNEENSYEEMTIAEIMNGKGDYFPGLIPLVLAYLEYINCDDLTMAQMMKYMDFIQKRTTGELITPASWIRNYIRKHPAYKFDSVVSDEIAYDLMIACKDIGEGKRHEPELLGDFRITPIEREGAYDVKLDSKKVNNNCIVHLLRRYSRRRSFSESNYGSAV